MFYQSQFYVTILETITKKFDSTKQQNLCFIYIHLFFLAFCISYLKLSRSLMSLNILLINNNFRSITDTYRARVCMSVTDGPEREELRRNNNKCFIVTVYNDWVSVLFNVSTLESQVWSLISPTCSFVVHRRHPESQPGPTVSVHHLHALDAN